MKDAEDEAFDELARRQGDWGGGFKAKQAMAADKLQETVSFPCCGYTDAIKWNQFNGVVQCHMCGQVYTVAQPVQEQWKCVGPPCKCNASNAKQCCYAVFTTPPLPVRPAQERASPCARHCEAQAFKIEIRMLKAQLAKPTQEKNI
jgi:hypothetical protein